MYVGGPIFCDCITRSDVRIIPLVLFVAFVYFVNFFAPFKVRFSLICKVIPQCPKQCYDNQSMQ